MAKKKAQVATPSEALLSDTVLRSHQVAHFSGTTTRALRHYHKIGLLPEVPRDPNRYRRYSANELVRVLRIRRLAASGMPLRKIKIVLEQDNATQDQMLVELEDDLREQARRIETQLQTLARLRKLSNQSTIFSTAEHTTKTAALDQNIWALLPSTEGVEPEIVEDMLDALQSEQVLGHLSAWYPEFERLEDHSYVDDETTVRLAHSMAEFADVLMKATGLSPAEDEKPIMPVIDHMLAEGSSPAQRKIWDCFLSIVEPRWTADHGHGNERHVPS